MKKFEDLQAWQTARALVNAIYEITKGESLARNYGLKDQIQRAAVSAMSNIAEGFARLNRREKIQLYNVARASAAEVRSLLYRDWETRSEEHTSELQSLSRTSYAVFCLKKKN